MGPQGHLSPKATHPRLGRVTKYSNTEKRTQRVRRKQDTEDLRKRINTVRISHLPHKEFMVTPRKMLMGSE